MAGTSDAAWLRLGLEALAGEILALQQPSQVWVIPRASESRWWDGAGLREALHRAAHRLHRRRTTPGAAGIAMRQTLASRAGAVVLWELATVAAQLATTQLKKSGNHYRLLMNARSRSGSSSSRRRRQRGGGGRGKEGEEEEEGSSSPGTFSHGVSGLKSRRWEEEKSSLS